MKLRHDKIYLHRTGGVYALNCDKASLFGLEREQAGRVSIDVYPDTKCLDRDEFIKVMKWAYENVAEDI